MHGTRKSSTPWKLLVHASQWNDQMSYHAIQYAHPSPSSMVYNSDNTTGAHPTNNSTHASIMGNTYSRLDWNGGENHHWPAKCSMEHRKLLGATTIKGQVLAPMHIPYLIPCPSITPHISYIYDMPPFVSLYPTQQLLPPLNTNIETPWNFSYIVHMIEQSLTAPTVHSNTQAQTTYPTDQQEGQGVDPIPTANPNNMDMLPLDTCNVPSFNINITNIYSLELMGKPIIP